MVRGGVQQGEGSQGLSRGTPSRDRGVFAGRRVCQGRQGRDGAVHHDQGGLRYASKKSPSLNVYPPRLLAALPTQSDKIFKKPASITLDEAAGIPIAGKTAYDCVIGLLHLDSTPPGTRVFINGGSTSVGAIAVQIAKHVCGVEVVSSCSGRNVDVVKEYGADQVGRAGWYMSGVSR